MTLIELASILGMIFGTSGLILGALGYLRDRPRVTVRLSWDGRVKGSALHDEKKLWGHVTVTNSGRRPVYISHVSISLPKDFSGSQLLLLDSIEGKKLGEGDPPAPFLIDQETLTTEYAPYWKMMRATVYDSTGKKYRSRSVSSRPSWAKVKENHGDK